MQIDDIRWRLRECGAKPIHEERILRAWIQALPLDAGRLPAENVLPLALRGALPALAAEIAHLGRVVSEHQSSDGSARLLVELADGQTVESVLLPRDGLCISSQVGCAVRCRFCMTGREGLLRQLGSAEMVAQVALARARKFIKKVVFMGMGEPAHNLVNVIEAIEFLGTLGGIGHKNLVFSTVGDERVFERLGKGVVNPALAISLHSTLPDRRAYLLPKAPPVEPRELVERAESYARATSYPIQYQWTLLEGVNDGEDELEGITRLLAGKYAILNLIPYNAIEGLEYRRPSLQHMLSFSRGLHERGIVTSLRNSAGQDVDGGCGQLRARANVPRQKLRI